MNLAVDIGNTRIKLGFFQRGVLTTRVVWENWNFSVLENFMTNQNPKNVILCNVGREIPAEVQLLLRSRSLFIELNADTPLPIKNAYRTPETLGKDRLAAVVGAFDMFPNQNCLVIDAGTCITLDVLSNEGVFLGGNITPGLEMRLRAMHYFTANLPLLKPSETEYRLGYSTESAMRNGAQWGATLEIQGFIDWCSAEFGEINVILTGGDADFFVKNLKSRIFANPNLVLQGLNKILDYNAEL